VSDRQAISANCRIAWFHAVRSPFLVERSATVTQGCRRSLRSTRRSARFEWFVCTSRLRRLLPADRLTELEPLTLPSFHELSRRVTTIFETAYPDMRLSEQLARPFGDVLWNLLERNHISSPRDATKLTVELLDLIRLRQDAVTAFLADLRRTLA
jgi:hypothetical protein